MFLKTYKKEIITLIVFVLIGQVVFAFFANKYTTPSYEGRIYATMAVKHDASDLHKLNEAAHYFGDTMIGWTKFPHFMEKVKSKVELPDGVYITGSHQERQNLIFTVHSPTLIELNKVINIKDFIQNEIDEYNKKSNTGFVFSNLDYEQITIQRDYKFGAGIVFVLSIFLFGGFAFIRKEFFL